MSMPAGARATPETLQQEGAKERADSGVHERAREHASGSERTANRGGNDTGVTESATSQTRAHQDQAKRQAGTTRYDTSETTHRQELSREDGVKPLTAARPSFMNTHFSASSDRFCSTRGMRRHENQMSKQARVQRRGSSQAASREILVQPDARTELTRRRAASKPAANHSAAQRDTQRNISTYHLDRQRQLRAERERAANEKASVLLRDLRNQARTAEQRDQPTGDDEPSVNRHGGRQH
jgi:hypothetical protein